MVKGKLKQLKIGNDLSAENLAQIKKKPTQTIYSHITKGSAAAKAIIDKAKSGNAEAAAQLEFAILELQVEAQDLANRTGIQKLAQDKEKFGLTMDLLGLQIEIKDLTNQMKTVDASNYEENANLVLTLKQLEVEGANLRNIGQLQNNQLHELNMEKLEKSIELIDASILEKQVPHYIPSSHLTDTDCYR